MAFSRDGTTLAVRDGVISRGFQIYERDKLNWAKKGGILLDNTMEGFSSDSVSLSADGSVVAIAGSDTVVVYHWDVWGWIRIGQTLVGNKPDGEFDMAVSVDLSNDGTALAVGFSSLGKVAVYDLIADSDNNDVEWIRRGNSSVVSAGNGAIQEWYAISLSGDGNTIAVGARGEIPREISLADLFKFPDELVKVFHWSGESWQQVGSDVKSGIAYARIGPSIDLSIDGNVIAIGSHGE